MSETTQKVRGLQRKEQRDIPAVTLTGYAGAEACSRQRRWLPGVSRKAGYTGRIDIDHCSAGGKQKAVNQ